MRKVAGLVMLVIILTSSCVTSTMVHFETPEPGAEVVVDGRSIGKTPTRMEMSNAVWEDPDIVVKQPGYRANYYSLEKEIKGVNLVVGIILWWPTLLWVWGPDEYQFIRMYEE